jgi:hypothetical protein
MTAADYLFGSLDNQRVRCGTFELTAAGLPVETTVTMQSLLVEQVRESA